MKEELKKFVTSIGGTAKYDGKTQTMFIRGNAEVLIKTRAEFQDKCDFKIEMDVELENKSSSRSKRTKLKGQKLKLNKV